MALHWIKRLWQSSEDDTASPNDTSPSNNTLLKEIASSITTLNQTLADNDRGVQKGLRRLSLAQKQQSEAIDTLTAESTSLQTTIANRHGIIVTYDQILPILDNINKITDTISQTTTHQTTNNSNNPSTTTTNTNTNTPTNQNNNLLPLITRTNTDLTTLSQLEPIAKLNHPYPTQHCEVVGAIESDEKDKQQKAGNVHSILQQGYQSKDGQIIRAAKVIVYKTNSQPHTTTDQELNHVN